MHHAVGLAGLVLFLMVAAEAFEVMLLPRRVRRSLRFVRYFFRGTWGLWSSVAKRLSRRSFRDAFLSLYGPLSMVLLLTSWASLIVLSLALVHYGLENGFERPLSLGGALYWSGSNFFTIVSGDVHPTTRLAKGLSVFEAGTGLAFITITISYLPVLYQLFSRREDRVIKLDARAGSPPSATGLLVRHGEQDALDELQRFLHEWEDWCTVLLESHLSYPMLSYYRSQHDNQSWLAAMATVLDTCALILTGLSGVRTFNAKMTFALARLAAVELSRVFHLKMQVHTTERLPREDFDKLREALEGAGLEFSSEEDPEERLRAIRATYEPFLFALSEHFLVQLPGWLPSTEPDNWQRSSRGRSAGRLVESSPVEPGQSRTANSESLVRMDNGASAITSQNSSS